MESALLEVRQELNVAIIEMMTHPSPSFDRIKRATEKLYSINVSQYN